MKICNTRSIRRVALAAAVAASSLISFVAPAMPVSAGAVNPVQLIFTPGEMKNIGFYSVNGFQGKTVLASIAVSGGSLSLKVTTTSGLTLSYGYTAFSGTALSFTGTQDSVNAALATLLVISSSKKDTAGTIKTMFTEAKDGVAYFPANQHFYQYVPYASNVTGTAKNADVAQSAATASKTYGLNGYLANISSKDENDFVTSKLQGAKNVWIGGSDAETEGKWIFTAGPDKGKNFWNGCASTLTTNPGSAPADVFTQWSPDGEPNNYISNTNKCGGSAYDPTASAGEDCIVTNWSYGDPKYIDGYWNDMPCDISGSSYSFPKVSGYVIEYGDSVDAATYDTTVNLGATQLVGITPKQVPISKKVAPKFNLGSKIASAFKKATAKASVYIKTVNSQGKTNRVKVKCPTKSKYIMTATIKLLPSSDRLAMYVRTRKKPGGYGGYRIIDQQCGTVIKTTGFTSRDYLRIIPLSRSDEMVSVKVYLDENPKDLDMVFFRRVTLATGSTYFIGGGISPVSTGWVRG